MNKSVHILFSIIISCLTLFIIETISNHWVKKNGTPLHKSLALLEISKEQGWKQKHNLQNVPFYNSLVCTNKFGHRISCKQKKKTINSRTKRVLLIGPSSSFGWGVDYEDTYGHYLESNLNKNSNDQWIVYNASQIGHTSWQGLISYQHLIKQGYYFDWIIVAFGLNELDRHRFFFESADSDLIALPRIRNLNFFSIKHFFSKFTTSHVLPYFLGQLLPKMQTSLPSTIRMSNKQFKNKINDFYKISNSHKSNIAFLTTASIYPFLGQHSSTHNNIINQSISLVSNKHYKKNILILNTIPESDPLKNESHYLLSHIYYKLGNKTKSKNEYLKSLKSEQYRLSAGIEKSNFLLKKINNKYKIIDIAKNISYKKQYFIDKVHFSKAGNLYIGSKISDFILSNHVLSN